MGLINRIELTCPSSWKSDTYSFQQQFEYTVNKINECIETLNSTIDFVNGLDLDTMVNTINTTLNSKVNEVNGKITEINQNITANNQATATAIQGIATALTNMQATLTAYIDGLIAAGKIEMQQEINTRLLQLENVENLPEEITLLLRDDILAAAAYLYDSGWTDGGVTFVGDWYTKYNPIADEPMFRARRVNDIVHVQIKCSVVTTIPPTSNQRYSWVFSTLDTQFRCPRKLILPCVLYDEYEDEAEVTHYISSPAVAIFDIYGNITIRDTKTYGVGEVRPTMLMAHFTYDRNLTGR